MELLKKLLQKALEMEANGEFDEIPLEEIEKLSILIHVPETMGREEAAKYLGISLNKFHELRDQHIIPEPRKRKGFKEKAYYTSDLCKCLKNKKL